MVFTLIGYDVSVHYCYLSLRLPNGMVYPLTYGRGLGPSLPTYPQEQYMSCLYLVGGQVGSLGGVKKGSKRGYFGGGQKGVKKGQKGGSRGLTGHQLEKLKTSVCVQGLSRAGSKMGFGK